MAFIELDRLIESGTPLATLAGTRVCGRTAGGVEYTGTVSAERDPRVTGNLYVKIDVDGGGWVRSDGVLETIETAHCRDCQRRMLTADMVAEGRPGIWLCPTCLATITAEQAAGVRRD